MNGKTKIDSVLNPCSAEMDKHTYGCELVNLSFYGKRLFRLHVGRLTVDVYNGGWKSFASMSGGANVSARYWQLFCPVGEISWVVKKKGVEVSNAR